MGHGGIKRLVDITGMSKNTIARGIREIESGETDCSRVRKEGQGRKKIETKYPKIIKEIEKMIEPVTRGSPVSSRCAGLVKAFEIYRYLLGIKDIL